MANLPTVGGSNGTWGTTLNEYLRVEHNADGTHSLKSLTDYQNVVVVDAGGNGDHTTLAAAMTAITDASSSNRYAILQFGAVVETTAVTSKDYIDVFGFGTIEFAGTDQISLFATISTFTNCHFLSTHSGDGSYITLGGSVILSNCLTEGVMYVVSGTPVMKNGSEVLGNLLISGGTLAAYACKFTAPSGNSAAVIIVNNTGTLKADYCHIEKMTGATGTTQAVYVRTGAIAELRHCKVLSTSVADAILMEASSTMLIEYCHVKSAGLKYGLNITMTPTSFLAIHSLFEAGTNRSVRADSAYTEAQFFQCGFKTNVTNITPAAGTALGTCVFF